MPTTTRMQKARETRRARAFLPPATAGEFQSFHRFPELPIELRCEIWTLSFPGPQIHGPPGRHGYLDQGRTIAKNPITLFINQESRAFTLQHYTLRDPGELNKNRGYKPPQPSCIDFRRDLVIYPDLEDYFSVVKEFTLDGKFYGRDCSAADMPDHFFDIRSFFFSRAEMGEISNLELKARDFQHARRQISTWLHDWLPFFTGLKNLSYVIPIIEEARNLMGDTYITTEGEVWSVEEKVVEYQDMVMEFLVEFRAKKLTEGIRWDIPNFKIDLLIIRYEEFMEGLRLLEALNTEANERRREAAEAAEREEKGRRGRRRRKGKGPALST